MGDHFLPPRRRLLPLLLFALPVLPGCSTLTQVAAHPVVTGIGLVSVAVTGKGLADHALDLFTRQDCRILEGLIKDDRRLCEQPGSIATLGDFRGLDVFGANADADHGAGDIALALDTRLDARGPGLIALAAPRPRGRPLRLALSTTPPVRTAAGAEAATPVQRDTLALLQ